MLLNNNEIKSSFTWSRVLCYSRNGLLALLAKFFGLCMPLLLRIAASQMYLHKKVTNLFTGFPKFAVSDDFNFPLFTPYSVLICCKVHIVVSCLIFCQVDSYLSYTEVIPIVWYCFWKVCYHFVSNCGPNITSRLI